MKDNSMKKNRIQLLFDKKKSDLVSVFYTAGFPVLDDTVTVAQHLQDAGADLIEIGIPFSDPVADGPTIQESSKVALANGMHLKLLLKQVEEIRKTVTIPIVLMGYLNPVIQYGIDLFLKDAARAGVDGLILPDLPLYEYEVKYKNVFQEYGLVNTFLVTPQTSEERIQKMDHLTSGFLYAVSSSSTTGSRTSFSEEQEKYFHRLREMKLKHPFLIGFGVANHQTYKTVCRYAAGAIVGSAFIQLISRSTSLKSDIHQFIKQLRGTST
jgi:tryptophan synthase alpha chain